MTDTIGYAGGIWLLWSSNVVHVDILATTEQEIHAIIRVRSQSLNWLISAIYASPRFTERCMLWENLKMLANLHDLPWAFIGDFNELLIEEEKSCGNPVCLRRVRAIKECMDACHVMDLGFSGPKFTWSNKRETGDLIQYRLHRCWANPGWKEFYPEANVTHLAKINSDHCPLVLSLNPNMGNILDRPFRFQSIWLNHEDFPSVVRATWEGQDVGLMSSISDFTVKARRWNKEGFGNVFVKKKLILARLLGTQKALASNPNPFLINLQNQLSEEYSLILQMEEEIWAMKARTNWIILGERNTSYFHMLALAWRSKNRITNIQNGDGEWVHDVEEVKGIFTSSFIKLYQTEQIFCNITPQWNTDWGAKLSLKEARGLSHSPFDEEIWTALKFMKPYKASGVDGLQAGFFQRFWLIVGNSVKREVKEAFTSQKVPEYLNQTLIALIPKQLGPELVSPYRPISLCNTVYKVISKIIVQRLRPLLPSLISPMQTAFLEGRRATDNVVIAQELIYSLKRRKGKEGYMVVKIYLEKAYDRLEWSFVKMVLEHFGLPQNIFNLIMSCISTTTITLLFNGNKLEAFHPSRGIRQGDPISP